ncbi:IDEAL domain-containing protein [Virgibacillus siamensis]|uniref:IDEAL domain-containing protein n=1 Tax=Virgibacillus siamensis TaxID=480071 RepID=UPI000986152E|nr:IDEAL domain-containing protein [Virgibacillus siamensis]
MVTVKMLKPYYIKADNEFIRVILAYQYFSVLIDEQVYQFVPTEAKEIRINRKTQKVENMGARFAFQKGKDIVYLTMTELISLPDFLLQLDVIAQPYYIFEEEKQNNQIDETALIIHELENMNLRRLIDQSLDERDKGKFISLTKLLQK